MRDQKNRKKFEVETEEVINVNEPVEEPIESNKEVNKTEAEVKNNSNKKILGKIVNCKALNIRKEPSIDSAVVCTVKAGNDLVIRDSTSIPEWYAVTEKYGFEGYVMSKYVRIGE